MQRLAILGAGGHGRVVADTAVQAGWETISFFDDFWPNISNGKKPPVVGNTEILLDLRDRFDGVIVAIGNNRARLRKLQEISNAKLPIVSLFHPFSYVSDDVKIGKGTVIFAGAVVQPGSILGNGSIINTGATVDHDCLLAAGSHICPGAHLAGGVSVGECTWIGIGSSVNQNISIGSDAIIGASTAVTKDVPNNTTMAGVPARAIQKG